MRGIAVAADCLAQHLRRIVLQRALDDALAVVVQDRLRVSIDTLPVSEDLFRPLWGTRGGFPSFSIPFPSLPFQSRSEWYVMAHGVVREYSLSPQGGIVGRHARRRGPVDDLML